eukprot:CAMPEP_0198687668 /NCGR_PEP_ID=MMETSP1468-20131203/70898_1 /TAXON_ID=1461545 /ORGANISM="Mantoniella sp, Strain CCMP1436" /LENGTH=215 /DNA_ID=CAMNT_0044435975 /DNA_START=408 /DNA_END=1055 /DNA_ORIENTATION=+
MSASRALNFSSSSRTPIHATAVTSASPMAISSSDGRSRKYTSSKQLQPPRPACLAGTVNANSSSSRVVATPNSSASSRTAVSTESCPDSMWPAAEMSHRFGNVSLFGERFCSATTCLSRSMSHTCTERCQSRSWCTNPRAFVAPVGTPFIVKISNPHITPSSSSRGGSITSNISDADCASVSASGFFMGTGGSPPPPSTSHDLSCVCGSGDPNSA